MLALAVKLRRLSQCASTHFRVHLVFGLLKTQLWVFLEVSQVFSYFKYLWVMLSLTTHEYFVFTILCIFRKYNPPKILFLFLNVFASKLTKRRQLAFSFLQKHRLSPAKPILTGLPSSRASFSEATPPLMNSLLLSLLRYSEGTHPFTLCRNTHTHRQASHTSWRRFFLKTHAKPWNMSRY